MAPEDLCDIVLFYLPVGDLLFQSLAFLNVSYMDNPCICLM